MKKKEYLIRSDLAIQNKNLKLLETYEEKNISIKNYTKENYHFTNILFPYPQTKEQQKNIKNIFIKEFENYFSKYHLDRKAKTLVVGLGNIKIASDSLGPLSVEHVIATGYISYLQVKNNYRPVYTFTPGVIEKSGFMSFTGIKALVKELNIACLIIIDSLVSSNISYLNNLIQITDIGITPGSGISCYQEEISEQTLNIPVIVIGVPTVIEASTIIKDALNCKSAKLEYLEGYDLMVTNKDIDIKINTLSKIIGEGLNEILNDIKF